MNSEYKMNDILNVAKANNPCFCIGPQNGEPLCPCAMQAKKVYKRNGRWIEPEHDLGEVKTQGLLTDGKEK